MSYIWKQVLYLLVRVHHYVHLLSASIFSAKLKIFFPQSDTVPPIQNQCHCKRDALYSLPCLK